MFEKKPKEKKPEIAIKSAEFQKINLPVLLIPSDLQKLKEIQKQVNNLILDLDCGKIIVLLESARSIIEDAISELKEKNKEVKQNAKR